MDEADERFEVLSSDGTPSGEVKTRAAVHRDGDWHRAFHLWIVKDGDHALLQRRAKAKDLGGGKVDVSVGGHFRVGETVRDVVREADEELGLVVRSGQLAYLGTVASERHYRADHDGVEATDREHQEVYAVRCDRRLSDYRLRCDEVFALYEVPLERVLQLYEDARYVPAEGFDCMGRTNNALLVEEDLIAQARETTATELRRLERWLETEDPDPIS